MAQTNDERRRAADILSQGPPPGGAKKGPKPLGVPEDFGAARPDPAGFREDAGNVLARPRQPAPGGTLAVPPRYFEGDEWGPASLSAERRAYLQRSLVLAGFLDEDDEFQLGAYDAPTRRAYKELLEYANASGLDERGALEEAARTVAQFPKVGKVKERAPLTVRLTNPRDLAAVAGALSPRVIGRRATQGEIDALVQRFHAEEAAAQRTAYGAAETGGTVTEAPTATSFLEEALRETDPQGATHMDIVGVSNEFFDLLRSSGG